VPEHDVRHEQRAIREGERVAEGGAFESHVGEDGHAGDGDDECHDVARRAQAQGGQQDGAEELDRTDRAERQLPDREIEDRIHRGEDDAQRDEQGPFARG
jgi:hypothetical protein